MWDVENMWGLCLNLPLGLENTMSFGTNPEKHLLLTTPIPQETVAHSIFSSTR